PKSSPSMGSYNIIAKLFFPNSSRTWSLIFHEDCPLLFLWGCVCFRCSFCSGRCLFLRIHTYVHAVLDHNSFRGFVNLTGLRPFQSAFIAGQTLYVDLSHCCLHGVADIGSAHIRCCSSLFKSSL